MKKILLSLSMILFIVAGFAAEASAKDMTRRFGLGIDSTIANYGGENRGLSVVYVINKYIGFQLLFGLETTTATVKYDVNNKDAQFDTTITEWMTSLRALIPIVLTQEVNLTGVVGFTASGRASDGFKGKREDARQYDDGYQFSIDLGVRPEWYVTEHFSIHTQLGVGINIITNSGSRPTVGLSKSEGTAYYSNDASGADISFFHNVDLLGQAGFTFWF